MPRLKPECDIETILYYTSCAQPTIDRPSGRGWKITENGLEINWCQEDILPHELVDILCDQPALENDNSDFELVNLCGAIQEEAFDNKDSVMNSSE